MSTTDYAKLSGSLEAAQQDVLAARNGSRLRSITTLVAVAASTISALWSYNRFMWVKLMTSVVAIAAMWLEFSSHSRLAEGYMRAMVQLAALQQEKDKLESKVGKLEAERQSIQMVEERRYREVAVQTLNPPKELHVEHANAPKPTLPPLAGALRAARRTPATEPVKCDPDVRRSWTTTDGADKDVHDTSKLKGDARDLGEGGCRSQ